MKKLALSFGLSLTVLAGCTSMPQKDETKANSLKVEFVGQGNYAVTQQQGTVSLYAVDSQIADVPATLIQQKKVQISQVPFAVDFTVPADHRKLLQPSVRDDAKIKYYVTWESDAKNLTGKDAIVIDYDRKFPNVTLNGGKQQIYLRSVK
ncbi:hypothetical protein [Acinetobacter genomosp. 15BJ]|uniref:Lipoprotein n=1 Tax=Acinetobacter genomosp. 15BJ TaxID=106651 RepID=R9ALU8_9GAMM|nr:hypothetical protein [Acinetobacter genomosp. 15BJ]EOR03050.1 hypothetical protein F896_03706 [Acinetobacter genomosp. 15BJ]MCH7291808.1 hypothetical protein [Acinetobacter genomosp. 15BJ]MDO3655875.1 hypothetical protein [Acinetobacter genomosp. 15BJ]